MSGNYKYVGAPYNFVPFYERILPADEEKQLKVHHLIKDDLLTGEISYTLTAKTPVFIDDGEKDENGKAKGNFTRNAYDKYAIPGSTMRGLIKNNVQILGLSGFEDDIDDYRLMYRNVADGAEKERYNSMLGSKAVPITPGSEPVSVLLNVKAGYIEKKGSSYVIYQTKVDKISKELGEMNYYVLSERIVAKDYGNGLKNYPFFKNNRNALQHDVSKGFEKYEDKNERIHYRGTENKSYTPGYYPVSYTVTGLKNVSGLGDPGQLANNGYLMCTGNMKEKKVLYVIPEMDETKGPVKISDADAKAFRTDFKMKENTLKRFKNVDFFNLPVDGETKPVFYIRLDGRLYFGFTPRLRLFYDHSLKEGYRQNRQKENDRQEVNEFDYAKSIFGMSSDNKSYKTKISFSDAVIDKIPEVMPDEREVILAGPKATSYLDYLKQGNSTTTYNTEDFELRGVKQYWLHSDIVMSYTQNNENKNVKSVLKPLGKDTVFRGKVRFQNLTEAELGLLLWSITLEEGSWMNVGKGKPYGYGAVSVSDVTVRTIDASSAYSLDQTLCLSPFREMNVQELIRAYKKEAKEKLNLRGDIKFLPHIQDFFAMKDSRRMPDPEKIRYMDINNKEYQGRKASLQTIGETAKEIPAEEKNRLAQERLEKLILDETYDAIVNKIDGKTVQFNVPSVEGCYPKIRIGEIKLTGITNKNASEMLPKGTSVKLKYLGIKEDGKAQWEFVSIVGR